MPQGGRSTFPCVSRRDASPRGLDCPTSLVLPRRHRPGIGLCGLYARAAIARAPTVWTWGSRAGDGTFSFSRPSRRRSRSCLWRSLDRGPQLRLGVDPDPIGSTAQDRVRGQGLQPWRRGVRRSAPRLCAEGRDARRWTDLQVGRRDRHEHARLRPGRATRVRVWPMGGP